MNLKALREKLGVAVAAMESIVNKCCTGEETRAMTDEEKTEFAAKEKEAGKIRSLIDAANKTREFKDTPTTTEPTAKEQTEETRSAEEIEAEETRAFANYIRSAVSGKPVEETRSDTNMTFSSNGAVVPSTIANKIISQLKDTCPIYNMATRYNVKGTLTIPYYSESTTQITMAYADEFTELESTSGTFTNISLTGFLAGVLTKISKSLINNSDFNLVSFVVQKVAEAARLWIEGECIKGTASKIAGLAAGVTQSITAASTTKITADELMDVQDKILDAFQGGCVWIMNRTTRNAIRKLKDANGNYLLNRDITAKWGYTLLGKDVYTTDKMDEAEATKTAIYYGDMSGLALKVVEDINLEILREKYATQHAIGVTAWMEVDAKVENAQKLAKLVMAAS